MTQSLHIAVIAAHPRRRSFTLAMATAFADACRADGAVVEVRDLYRLGFDPRLRAREMPDHPGYAPRADVVRERQAIGDANVFALFYPLWFNAPPAMLKGYVDRVFGMGFGYSPIQRGGNQPLLVGRKLVSFTSSGAPQDWVERSGAWAAMHKQFDEHLSLMTGLEIADRHNFGAIGPGLAPIRFKECCAEVDRHARRLTAGHRPAS